MTKLPLWESAGVTLINKGIYDKMPAEQRAGFDAGVRKTPVEHAARRDPRRGHGADRRRTSRAAASSSQATPEQRAEWSKDLGPVWAAIAKDIGPDGEKYLALMDAGKKACGK